MHARAGRSLARSGHPGPLAGAQLPAQGLERGPETAVRPGPPGPAGTHVGARLGEPHPAPMRAPGPPGRRPGRAGFLGSGRRRPERGPALGRQLRGAGDPAYPGLAVHRSGRRSQRLAAAPHPGPGPGRRAARHAGPDAPAAPGGGRHAQVAGHLVRPARRTGTGPLVPGGTALGSGRPGGPRKGPGPVRLGARPALGDLPG